MGKLKKIPVFDWTRLVSKKPHSYYLKRLQVEEEYNSLHVDVEYFYNSGKGRMPFPRNLRLFDIISLKKKGNNYTLYLKRRFHIYGEIDLIRETHDMEDIQWCNTEFAPYMIETLKTVNNKNR